MSKVYFRNIEKEDLNQVFVLLNQLKPMDISKVDPEGKQPTQVMSLCKLKTLEYRLFRKMREKLRNYYGRNTGEEQANDFEGFSKKWAQFKKESKQL